MTKHKILAGLIALAALLAACDEVGVSHLNPPPDPLWHADADVDEDLAPDTTKFFRREVTSGIWSRLSIVDDPLGLHGKVYKANVTPADIAAGLKRAEWRGAYAGDGNTRVKLAVPGTENVWIGWRSLFGPDVVLNGADNGGNYMQLKGDSSCGGPAVGLTISGNRLSLRTIDGPPEGQVAWVGPLVADVIGTWQDFALHVNFAKDNTGYLELWLDGKVQTMTNGSTRIYLPTVCPNDLYVFPKFGVYGMDLGVGVGPEHWVESPRFGETYDSAAPR